VGERADQPPILGRSNVTGGPNVTHAGISGEDRIVRRNFTQCSRDWLRVHGCSFSNVIYVNIQFAKCIFVFCDHRIQERSVGLCFYHWQKRLNGFAYIAPNTEIQFASPAQMVDPDVNLDYLGLCWQEFVIREISAQ